MNENEFEIINNSAKFEKLKKIVIENSKFLLSILIIILLSIVGFFIYNDVKKKNRIKISEKYNKLLVSENLNDNVDELIEIILERDKTYSPLALYYIIDNNLAVTDDEINRYFDIIINEVGLEENLKYLNIYKMSLFNAQLENEIEFLKIIEPLLKSENIWKSHGLYLLGEYYYAKGDKIKSKKYFNEIVLNKNTNSKIKLEAQKRIQRDLSD